MDSSNTLWLDAKINDLYREACNRRDSVEGYWDGYCSPISDTAGDYKKVRDDIRRRERMAEAMYEV
tara:strand:+ start:348 stop:545 length:198 start_codon:yes stop_codon:yes gene_type:complete